MALGNLSTLQRGLHLCSILYLFYMLQAQMRINNILSSPRLSRAFNFYQIFNQHIQDIEKQLLYTSFIGFSDQ